MELFLPMPSRGRLSLLACATCATLTILTVAIATGARVAAQSPSPTAATKHGIVRRMADVKFAPDDDVKCLNGVVREWRPGHRSLDLCLEGDFRLRGGSALPHRGRTVDRGARRCSHRHAWHEGNASGARRLRHDARKGNALVHVHVQRRLPDVRNLRSHLRHRLGQRRKIITRIESSSFL